MIKHYIVNLSNVYDPETGHSCGGGYGIPATREIFIDKRLTPNKKREVALHETLEFYLRGRITHGGINDLAKDIIQVMIDLGYMTKEATE